MRLTAPARFLSLRALVQVILGWAPFHRSYRKRVRNNKARDPPHRPTADRIKSGASCPARARSAAIRSRFIRVRSHSPNFSSCPISQRSWSRKMYARARARQSPACSYQRDKIDLEKEARVNRSRTSFFCNTLCPLLNCVYTPNSNCKEYLNKNNVSYNFGDPSCRCMLRIYGTKMRSFVPIINYRHGEWFSTDVAVTHGEKR